MVASKKKGALDLYGVDRDVHIVVRAVNVGRLAGVRLV